MLSVQELDKELTLYVTTGNNLDRTSNQPRNSVATEEIYPLESEVRICEECKTGDLVMIELEQSLLINHTTGKKYNLKPIGDAGPVIEAGGIFAYARKTGMIPA
ncbi:hypothetical protein R6Q59_015320 [Mikania micrantha]